MLRTPRRAPGSAAALLLTGSLAAALAAAGCHRDDYGPRTEKAAKSDAAAPTAEQVAALGRLRPRSVIHLAGPSRLAVVVEQVLVKEGDPVTAGQVVAILDTAGSESADVDLRQAELRNAERELSRIRNLFRQGIVSRADVDRSESSRDVAAAALRKAESELTLSQVRAPVAGRVLELHVHSGERVGDAGILELAEDGPMYAIAEVYETDAPHVRPGQRATVTSPALAGGTLHGTVERVGLQVARQKVLGTDPAAQRDARVVEVEIRLDDGAVAAELTGLQVQVVIDTSPPPTGG